MKYAIWNKQDTIYTPSGEEFTAEQWNYDVRTRQNITDSRFAGSCRERS